MHPLMTLIGGGLLAYSKIVTFPPSFSAHLAKLITVVISFLGLGLIAFAKREKLPVLNKLPRFAAAGSTLAGLLSLGAGLIAVVAEGMSQAGVGGPGTQILLTIIGGAGALFFAKEDLPAITAPAAMLALAVGLLVGQPACATFWSNLPAVVADVNEADGYVSQVKTFVDMYFQRHPNPDLQAKIDAQIVKVQMASSAVLAAGRGAADIDGGNVAGAIAEFQAAYADLLALVKSFGVQQAQPAALAAGKRRASLDTSILLVPGPKDLFKTTR